MKSKKGLSGVITVVILVALTLVAISIVWVSIKSVLKNKLSNVESCFDVFGKVTINRLYTCYNSSSNVADISVERTDIGMDKVIISLYGKGESKSFEVPSSEGYSFVKPYEGSYGDPLSLPEKNSALTYGVKITNAGISELSSIKISPVIKGETCSPSDSLLNIEEC